MIPPTNVRATCNSCGDIKTTIDKVTVRILVDRIEDRIGEYRMLCPQCKMTIIKPANANVIQLLVNEGANIEYYNLPLELLERPTVFDASPINADEIIDLHFQLEGNEEEWMQRMVGNNE